MNRELVLEADGLAKRFGDVTGVESVNFTVGSGEVFGLLGPNGAGKSTTLDLLLGYTEPTAGRAVVFGEDVTEAPRSVRRRTGILPDDYGVYREMSGRTHLETFLRLNDADDDPDRLRERVGLSSEAFERPVGTYSTGMRQRLALATALAGGPELLVLDEPMSGLDPDGITLVRETVRELAATGVSVLLSSHRLGEVEAVCDRVGFLVDGELVSVESVDALAVSGGSERVEMTLADTVPGGVTDALDDTDGVRVVTTDGRALVVECRTAAEKATALRVVDSSVSVTDFTVTSPDLEDVFRETVSEDRSTDASELATIPSDRTAATSTSGDGGVGR